MDDLWWFTFWTIAGLLAAMALMWAFIRVALWIGERESGPWAVEKDGEYLGFPSPAEYGFTTVKRHVNKFDSKAVAETWADYVRGNVVPWSDIK